MLDRENGFCYVTITDIYVLPSLRSMEKVCNVLEAKHVSVIIALFQEINIKERQLAFDCQKRTKVDQFRSSKKDEREISNSRLHEKKTVDPARILQDYHVRTEQTKYILSFSWLYQC